MRQAESAGLQENGAYERMFLCLMNCNEDSKIVAIGVRQGLASPERVQIFDNAKPDGRPQYP